MVAIIQRLRVQIQGQAGAASWALGGGQEVFSGQRWSRSLSFGRVLSPKSVGLADAGSSANLIKVMYYEKLGVSRVASNELVPSHTIHWLAVDL